MTNICGLLTTKPFNFKDVTFEGAGEIFDSVALGCTASQLSNLLSSRYIAVSAIATLEEDGSVKLLIDKRKVEPAEKAPSQPQKSTKSKSSERQ